MKKELRNKGFSLIELIVIIAIMGVMLAVGGYSLTAISSANAKQCAKELEAGLISTRTQSYSSDTDASMATVSFYKGTDGIYMKKSFETEAKKIGGSKVSVSYKLTGGTDYVELGNDPITFSFNRSSAAFNPAMIAGSSAHCESIKISSGTKVYTITCYEHTGKTMLE